MENKEIANNLDREISNFNMRHAITASEIYRRDTLKVAATIVRKLENGQLVELPCKVGDTVYFIKSMFTLLRKPQECQIENWSMYANGTIKFVAKYKDVCEKIFYEDTIGKTVFLTKVEAEAELEKRTVIEKT